MKENEALRQVQQEERNTLEAALKSRDLLMAKLAKAEKQYDETVREYQSELKKITHNSQMDLTKLKMEKSSVVTKGIVEKKESTKANTHLQARIMEVEQHAAKDVSEKQDRIVELERLLSQLQTDLQVVSQGGSNQSRELSKLLEQERLNAAQLREQIVSLNSSLHMATEEIATLRSRFEHDYTTLEAECRELRNRLTEQTKVSEEPVAMSVEALPIHAANEPPRTKEEEIAIIHCHLRAIYESFCAFGSDRNLDARTVQQNETSDPQIDGPRFNKFAKDCKIIDYKRITSSDVDIMFNTVKPKGSRKINYDLFKRACRLLAAKRSPNVSEEKAFNLLLVHICDKGPISRSAIIQGLALAYSHSTANSFSRINGSSQKLSRSHVSVNKAGGKRGQTEMVTISTEDLKSAKKIVK